MSDIAESFRAMREYSQQKRASNREHSARMLTESQVPYESRNGGAHLIVSFGVVVVDFWPGTGKWIDRAGNQGRGVMNLLQHIGAKR